ncbi:hypothetical protein QMK33_22125 [Hymenobacter sp. H14-R3]|uniref:hypothetical protein n=1 Tax=Hymenobacter sp. H14-R3 TaxID=3046308 RepID=UPI0024B9C438|nr:hypothetical protein [Hymenobacter sp. H14-R3]MDJ0367852.1 hypothetical protein [Hymenobacter sp. H14-R3]
MKTSTTYLLAALLVLLASLTAYNMALRTEYRSGAYKDPLRNYEVLDFKNFTEIEIPAGSALSVKVMAGPFGVRVNPAAARFVHVSQHGGQLRLALAFPHEPESLGWGETVVVSCPRLAALTTGATYEAAGQPRHDLNLTGRNTLVQGFTQDSLTLRADQGSQVELISNRLGYLRAVVGPTRGSPTKLQLNPTNRIAAGHLRMQSKSQLVLNTIATPQLRYELADSARLTASGAVLTSVRRY